MGVLPDSQGKSVRERVDECTAYDPLLIKKAVVSRYFNEPITTIMDRLTIDEVDDLYNVALHLVDLIDMAPFKQSSK